MKKLLHKIHHFLFGSVYYAVIIGEAGSGDRYDIASQIHSSRAETVKFRSRNLDFRL